MSPQRWYTKPYTVVRQRNRSSHSQYGIIPVSCGGVGFEGAQGCKCQDELFFQIFKIFPEAAEEHMAYKETGNKVY